MNKKLLERMSVLVSVAIVVGWGIFWGTQVVAVQEMLKLAYG
ncbi:MAG: hypothetical protein P8N51_04805 [Pseudomonadales bacterium]|jgi:hypothetical protein|nr:hypothetical protein [Pseudomonadales bacterium]MDG1441634.1 hypothetical protein [Pseudomonadales bacterium]